MLTLHVIGERGSVAEHGLEAAIVSIGMVAPSQSARDDRLVVYDFGQRKELEIEPWSVLALADAEVPRTSFAPPLRFEAQRMAANAQVVRFPVRRKLPRVPDAFLTGYETYAKKAAMFWRSHGFGSQPLLAAGVFSLASIQTSIERALMLFQGLMPYVIEDRLPSQAKLAKVVAASGAGLHESRPLWFREYCAWRGEIQGARDEAIDDGLRRILCLDVGLPRGLGLAKLSFTLALVGMNLGCLDARIVSYAFTKHTAQKFLGRVNRKKDDGTFTAATYAVYRKAELDILTKTPFYNERDPVALSRSQWMLWESLGPEESRTHTHEELFRAVVDDRLGTLTS